MANRITPEAQLMTGLFVFIKNIVTIALGIVLGGYLILKIAEHKAQDMVRAFEEGQRNAVQLK